MENELTGPITPFAEFNRRTFFGIILTGIATAAITLLLAKGLNHFIISPALCRGATQTVCQNSTSVSFHIAALVAAIIGVALLVNLSVYRPLLVVIAVTAGSWALYNAPLPLIILPWFWQLGIIFAVNTLALLTFSWILRAYNIIIPLILTVLLVAAMIAVIVV